METTYLLQGGRQIGIEHKGNRVTIEVDGVEKAFKAAEHADVQVRDVRPFTGGMVGMTVRGDLEKAMHELRKSNVVHHLYHTEGQPDDEVVITDSMFLKFADGTSEQTIADYLAEHNLERVRALEDGTLLVRVTDETGVNPIRVANAARTHGVVEYAEPNLVHNLRRFGFLPEDELFHRQWHLRAHSASIDLVPGAGIGAPEAWTRTKGIRDVVVAIADDGFDLTHPDFEGDGKIVGKIDVELDGDGLRMGDNVLPRPGDYHGTPCAGVAVAEANGQGTVGVAPGASMLAVRFPLDLSDAQLIDMFGHISQRADIVSCSWGYGPANRPMSTPLRNTITRLAATGGRRGKGLVFCVAAGNNNCPIYEPDNRRLYPYLDGSGVVRKYSGPIDRWIAAHPDVLTVSASTSLKSRAVYSSWGKEVNVCAPSDNFDDLGRFKPRGLGIVTTDNEGYGADSDFTPKSRFTSDFGGTSSATPTVAGVCALVLSQNLKLTGKEIRQIVELTADKDLDVSSESPVNEPGEFDGDGFSLWFGHGKVNAPRAVGLAAEWVTPTDGGVAPPTDGGVAPPAADEPAHAPAADAPVGWFAAPARIGDLDARLRQGWSTEIHARFAAVEARLRDELSVVPPRLFNLLDRPEATKRERHQLRWNAFPAKHRGAIADPEDRWRRIEWPVNRDASGRQLPYFYRNPAGYQRASDLFFRDLDEYCEWKSYYHPDSGELERVVFTCESPEYWKFIADNDRDLLLHLYRQLAGPRVELADLFFDTDVFYPHRGTARTNGRFENLRGRYNPHNKWNRNLGIAHLSHPANSLAAGMFLVGDATVARIDGAGQPVVDADALIRCGAFGSPDRASDPTIGAQINALARGAGVTIGDPVGVYIHSLDESAFELPQGVTVDDLWHVTRGDRDAHMILRAEFRAPDSAKIHLGDIRVAGEKLAYGSQIAEHLCMVLHVETCDLGLGETAAQACTVAMAASVLALVTGVADVEDFSRR